MWHLKLYTCHRCCEKFIRRREEKLGQRAECWRIKISNTNKLRDFTEKKNRRKQNFFWIKFIVCSGARLHISSFWPGDRLLCGKVKFEFFTINFINAVTAPTVHEAKKWFFFKENNNNNNNNDDDNDYYYYYFLHILDLDSSSLLQRPGAQKREWDALHCTLPRLVRSGTAEWMQIFLRTFQTTTQVLGIRSTCIRNL